MQCKSHLVLCSLLCLCVGVRGVFTPVVDIEQGKLRGLRSVSGQNRYYGIPYAVSERFQVIARGPPRLFTSVYHGKKCFPVVHRKVHNNTHCNTKENYGIVTDGFTPNRQFFISNNKFFPEGRAKPPQEPPKWDGVFTAVNRLGHCAQRITFLTLGSEDCLHLDLYAPERPARGLPVLVFLHGGAYYYGTKGHYDPEFLVIKNVVVVIINYRLGVLGFLCANGVANLGLKDQVAALKWIRKNIAAFGGDPDNVTISGQSAGASAAAMHILSKSSKGLFHKLILMSGTPMTPWAFNMEPLNPAMKDAGKLGKVSSEVDIYNVFANASIPDLMATCRDVSTNPRYFKYSPCVDANNTDPFFHDTPLNIIKSGRFNKVPIIIGYTDVEGMLFYGIHNDQTLKEWNDNFMERLPSVFSWCPEETKNRIARELREHYFGNRTIDKYAIRGVVDFYSDWIVYASVDDFIDLMNRYSDQPVYNYMFAYEGERNFAKFAFGLRTGLEGASHSDDIFYVFKPAGLSLLINKYDRIFIDRLTTMLANFMRFGNPTPAKSVLTPVLWPASRGNATRVLRLSRAPTLLRGDAAAGARAGAGARRMRALLCAHAQQGYAPCDHATDNNV